MNTYENIYISKIAHYLPERIVTNDEIIKNHSLKIKSSWIENHLGIKTRRWANDDQTTSDLIVNVLNQLNGSEAPIFLSTISPDHLTPSTSSIVKRKMHWSGNDFTIDLNAACAGFIFSLEFCALYLSSSSVEKAYSMAAEMRSRFLNMEDRRTVFLFSDASAGVLVHKKHNDSIAKLNWTHISTESTIEPEILIPSGGAKYPLSIAALNQQDHKIKMVDGALITNTIEAKLVSEINKILKLRNEDIGSYDFFVFHQGNGKLIINILEQLNLPPNQTHINFDKYGNSSSASLPVALSEAHQLKLIKSNQKVLLVAMGAGHHLGLAGLHWV